MLATSPRSTNEAAAPHATPVGRASYAVGFATGRDFRGILPPALAPFEQGLRDGLAGPPRDARVMSRPELFARIRGTMKLLGDAELAAVAARIDESQDR
ncbi:MAG: hypothetical protein AB1689_05970 [Thermodesulfobacteriota bacterium]